MVEGQVEVVGRAVRRSRRNTYVLFIIVIVYVLCNLPRIILNLAEYLLQVCFILLLLLLRVLPLLLLLLRILLFILIPILNFTFHRKLNSMKRLFQVQKLYYTYTKKLSHVENQDISNKDT